MRKIIALFVVTILVSLSNVVAAEDTTTVEDSSTWTVIDDGWVVVEEDDEYNEDDDDDSSEDDDEYNEDDDDDSSEDDDEYNEDDDDDSSEDDDESNEDDDDDSSEDDDESNEDDEENEDEFVWTYVERMQNHYVASFNKLREEYKSRMWDKKWASEFAKKQNELFKEYRERLKEVEKRARDAFKEKAKTVRENVRERSDTGIVRYKETYTRKYGRMISNLSDEKIQILIDRIDALVEKVTNGDYTDEARERLLSMLAAIREIATDNLAQDNPAQLDLDALFENLN